MSKELVKQTLQELAESHVPANPDLWPKIYDHLISQEVSQTQTTSQSKLFFEPNPTPQIGSTVKPSGIKKDSARISIPRLVVVGMSLAVFFVTIILFMTFINANLSNSVQQSLGNKFASPVATQTNREDMDATIKDCEQLKLGNFDCLMKIYDNFQYPLSWVSLGKDLNLGQTNNGFTMTIRRVYADRSTIFVGYEVKGPEGVRFNVGDLTLTDEQSKAIAAGSASTVGYNNALFAPFDGTFIKGNPQSIKVHLAVSKISIRDNPPSPTLELNPTPTPATPLTSGSTIASTAGPNSFVNVPTSFAFDFEIPFHGGQIIELNQTVKAGERGLALQRAIVAPSGTRLLLSGFDKNRFMIEASLTAGSNTSSAAASGAVSQDSEEFSWLADLTKLPGEWSLTVTEISEEGVNCTWTPHQCTFPTPGAPAPKRFTSGGPWTFHFNVPKL